MSRPSCATATLTIFQRGLDLTPQSRAAIVLTCALSMVPSRTRCHQRNIRLASRNRIRPVASPRPPRSIMAWKSRSKCDQQICRHAGSIHSNELCRSPATTRFGWSSPSTRLDHRAGSFGRDGEDRRQRGQDHPQLSLAGDSRATRCRRCRPPRRHGRRAPLRCRGFHLPWSIAA